MTDDVEWQNILLEDIAAPTRNALVGGPFGSDLVSSDYTPTGIPVIRGENVSVGRWVQGDFVFISPQKAKKLEANTASRLDIVFTQRGANHFRQVAIVPTDGFERFVISQSQMKLTVDRRTADPIFIYYAFRAPAQQNYLHRNAIQTGVPHTNLSILRKTPLCVPPLEIQRAITRILGALDDKIELNRRINKTLGAMARALFKSWFVDFDPVRAKAEGNEPGLPAPLDDLFPNSFVDSDFGEIPEGWSVKRLDELARFVNGLALQKYPPSDGKSLPVIKIAQLRSRNIIGADRASADLDPDYIVQDGDILFSWSGSLECVLWAGGPGALNQHLFRVIPASYPRWLCYLGIHLHLEVFRHIAAGKATTMGHIQRRHLSDAKLPVPPPKLMRAMNVIIQPILEGTWTREVQSRTLAVIRDALLPRLMSGQIRMRDGQALCEAALAETS